MKYIITSILLLISSISFASNEPLGIFDLMNGWRPMATNQYVDPSYSGVSTGSITQPWKTIASVNQSLINSGDSVLLRRGQKFLLAQYTITRSGTASAPIVFGAYGTGAAPHIWGNGSTLAQLFYLNNRSYIVFDGLNISDTTISVSDRTIAAKIQRAFYLDGSTNNVVIKNCRMDRVGVGVYMVGPNNQMIGNDIGNMRMVRNTPVNVHPDDDYGANPVVISSAGNIISQNYFHDCWAVSYDYAYDGGAIEFFGNGASNNTVTYNTFYDCNGIVESGSGNAGTIQNNLFAYNKMINNSSLFFISNNGSFIVDVRNMQFYNNVIVETVVGRLNESNMCSFRVNTSTANVVTMRNNIFYLTNGIDVFRANQFNAGQLVASNNIYILGAGSALNKTAAAGELVTNIPASDVWMATSGNPITWDFRPKALSPAIEFGTSISGFNMDFCGNAIVNKPEAGLCEYGVTVPPPPTNAPKEYILKGAVEYQLN